MSLPNEPAAAPAAAELPGAPAADGWHRLHPLSPVLRGGLVFLVIAGIVVANLRDRLMSLFLGDALPGGGSQGDDLVDLVFERQLVLVVLLAVLGVVLLAVGAAWLSWRKHTYRITADAVETRSGVLSRKHRRAPLDRVQGVNLQRPLLARLLGLSALEVTTAGQDGTVPLTYLSHRDATELRQTILASVATARAAKRGEAVPGAPAATPAGAATAAPAGLGGLLESRVEDLVTPDLDPLLTPADSIVRIPVVRLIGSILLSWDLIITAGLLVGVIVAGIVWHPAILFSVLPLGIGLVSILFGRFTKGMNFHLSHSSQGVRVSSGLLATVTDTIPADRIHAVEARQPLLWRGFGWWTVMITTAGFGVATAGKSAAANIMLPVGRLEDAAAVLDLLLPGHGLDREAMRDGLVGDAAGWLGSPPRAWPVLMLGRARNGVRFGGAGAPVPTLQQRRGFLTRRFSLVPLARVQSVLLHRAGRQRFLGLAAVQAQTVVGPVHTTTNGLDLADAQLLFAELAAATVRAGGAERPGAAV